MKYNIFRTSQTITGFYSKEDKAPCDNAELIVDVISYHYEIEINSLEDLNKLQEKVKCPLIISDESNMKELCSKTIEIYDDYRYEDLVRQTNLTKFNYDPFTGKKIN